MNLEMPFLDFSSYISSHIPLIFLLIFFDIIAREQRPEATDAAYVSNGNNADYKLVREEIKELINLNPAKGPTLVRLAWHSSGTYSKMLQDGGSSKGTIRFKEELAHGANAGLDTAIIGKILQANLGNRKMSGHRWTSGLMMLA